MDLSVQEKKRFTRFFLRFLFSSPLCCYNPPVLLLFLFLLRPPRRRRRRRSNNRRRSPLQGRDDALSCRRRRRYRRRRRHTAPSPHVHPAHRPQHKQPDVGAAPVAKVRRECREVLVLRRARLQLKVQTAPRAGQRPRPALESWSAVESWPEA